MNWRGVFTGQYICCTLEDFCGLNLHHRADAKTFSKLRLHRTEVCRRPVNMPGTPPDQMDLPIFPLRAKFEAHNNTIEGLETGLSKEGRKMGDPVSTSVDLSRCPPAETGDGDKDAVDAGYGSPLYKYVRRGRKLPIDAQGSWIRQTTDPRGFRPETYSAAE